MHMLLSGRETPDASKPKSPTLEVTVPIVRLTIEDLAYLKSMTQDGVHCAIKFSRLAKLKILGLVKEMDVPPSRERTDALQSKVREFQESVAELAKSEQWDKIEKLLSTIRSDKRYLVPQRKDVLSAAGKALLEKGAVKVALPQGCGGSRKR